MSRSSGYEGAGTSDRRWLHQDRLGSVIAVSNASGAALSINTYDEYGQPGSSNAGRFQYTGQMWIPEASLYHYKARAYAPGLGRFLQTDPILQAGGMNIYAYVGNDPVNGRDPWGLFGDPHPDGGGGGGVTGGGVVTSGWTSPWGWAPQPVPGNPGCFEDRETDPPEYGCQVPRLPLGWASVRAGRGSRNPGDGGGAGSDAPHPSQPLPPIDILPYPQRSECQRLQQAHRDEQLREALSSNNRNNIHQMGTRMTQFTLALLGVRAGGVGGAVLGAGTGHAASQTEYPGEAFWGGIERGAVLEQGGIEQQFEEQCGG